MAEFKAEKSIFGHNKDTLSWSAYSLWTSSKDQYRKKYYEEIRPSFETAESIFGKKIGQYLEDGHEEVAHIKRYSHPEYKIMVEVEGVKLLGYLDSFGLKELAFLEYKTSHKNKEGKHYWDAVKVAKHGQLDFYSMLIQEKFGKVTEECELIYLETEENVIKYKGHTLQPADKGLRLNGNVKTFKRTIEQWERDAIKRKILEVAKEIKKDYEQYRKENNIQALQQNGEKRTQKKSKK